MRFRPALLPTLAAGLVLTVTVNLALWQLRRHHEAQDRVVAVHAHLDDPPIASADLSSRTPDDLAWRTGTFAGQYVDTAPLLIAGRFEGGVPGYGVIAPFQVDGGPVVLVDRGWIPSDGWAATLDAIRVPGPTSISGLVLPIEPGATATPLPAAADKPERWPQATEAFLGCGTRAVGPPWASLAARAGQVAPVYVVLGPQLRREQVRPRDTLPVSGFVAEPKFVDHLNYAGQWSLISATLVAVWAYAGVRRGRA